MKMNRTFAFLAVTFLGGLAAFSPVAQAQEKKDEKAAPQPAPPAAPAEAKPGAPAAPRPGAVRVDRTEQLGVFLKLDDKQKEKVKPILDDEQKKLTEWRTAKDLKPEERRAKYLEIREATNAKIKPILTEEQWEKYARMRGLGPRTNAPASPTPAPTK
jgi:hypothetical protein